MSKVEQKSGAHSSNAKSNYDGQECESLRSGTEKRLNESVKDAVENRTVHGKAKAARYASNGEPSAAPDHNDAQAEKAKTASKGSKSK